MSLLTTPSQTLGPFGAIIFDPTEVREIAPPGVAGERITVRGRIVDGDGAPVGDATLEVWQANGHGKYAHPEDVQEKPLDDRFKGFGRVSTNSDGVFQFSTIKPGAVPGPNGSTQAPHLTLVIFMRGLLKHLVTRMYFEGEPGNANDPVLTLVPDARRETLIARKQGTTYEMSINLQGPKETVYFDW
jgi:protocatechuate 3,4-dioxygenase alpha subunit